MEMISRDLKSMGVLASASISFGKCPQSNKPVEYRECIHYLTPQQREMYNSAAAAWQVVMQNIDKALGITNGGVNHRSLCDSTAVRTLFCNKSHATRNRRGCDQFWFLQKRVRLVYTTLVIRPVRKVPKNYRNATGLISTTKSDRMTAYESRLEHDFMKLVGFDPRVSHYVEQPAKIEFTDGTGRLRSYTPDILVIYHPHQDPAQETKPLLAEIKYRKDLFKNWPDLKPKFQAARRYAREKGWEFKIITEVEIRTPFLKNVVFLLEYRDLTVGDAEIKLLLETLNHLGGADPDELLLAISEDRIKRAQLLPMLWYLVANDRIGLDLTQPLTMRSRLWATP